MNRSPLDPLELVVLADLLPSAQVEVNKQNSSFQNWEVSGIPKIYSAIVEYKASSQKSKSTWQVDTYIVLPQTMSEKRFDSPFGLW